jgi:hypothetical protein
MLHERPDNLTFCTVTHVENEGIIYEIFPIGNRVVKFIIVPEDGGAAQTLTQDELEARGFVPIDLIKQVRMKPETSTPVDLVDKLEQMRNGTQKDLLSWQEEDFPKKK